MEKTTCQLCKRRYNMDIDDKEAVPRLLQSCGHTFCSRCLDAIWMRDGERAACPDCGTQFLSTTTNVDIENTGNGIGQCSTCRQPTSIRKMRHCLTCDAASTDDNVDIVDKGICADCFLDHHTQHQLEWHTVVVNEICDRERQRSIFNRNRITDQMNTTISNRIHDVSESMNNLQLNIDDLNRRYVDPYQTMLMPDNNQLLTSVDLLMARDKATEDNDKLRMQYNGIETNLIEINQVIENISSTLIMSNNAVVAVQMPVLIETEHQDEDEISTTDRVVGHPSTTAICIDDADREHSTIADAQPIARGNGTAIDNERWTWLGEPTATIDHDLSPLYRNYDEIYHVDPIIRKTLNDLARMGHPNSDLLVQLVEEHRGDINAVLDVLGPVA